MRNRDDRIWVCSILSFRIHTRKGSAINDAVRYLREMKHKFPPGEYTWVSDGSGFTITLRCDGSVYLVDKWSATNNLT